VGFEPVDFGVTDGDIVESHGGESRHLSPTPAALAAIEMLPDPSAGTAGDDDGASDWGDYLESHAVQRVT